MYVVILAGGGGTRLWPLSTPERPKPFIPLLATGTLLEHTIDRLAGLVSTGDIAVVTDRRYEEQVRALAPGVAVLAEPEGRNTAAAIALATAAIDRPEDEVMAVLPADHLIEREDVFRGVLRAAAGGLAHGAFGIEAPLVTLGIAVDRPATEYGYLIPEFEQGADVAGLHSFPLRAFEEKPSAARAGELQASPGVAWNAGMFLWQRRAIRAALERHTSLLATIGPATGDAAALAVAYAAVDPISVDYAVMEPAARDDQVVMGAMDVGWSDLGGWPALLAALGGPAVGRVVQPGEPFRPGTDDLVLVRRDGRLALLAGGGASMTSAAPMAHFPGARSARPILDALVQRVDLAEMRP